MSHDTYVLFNLFYAQKEHTLPFKKSENMKNARRK